MFYFYAQKSSSNIVLTKNLNITIESFKNKNETELELKIDPFYDLILDFNDKERWFPMYTDNSKWNHIEFISKIKIKLILVSNVESLRREFKFVRFSDLF